RLADWLAAWRDGNQAPLAFYPETAWAWQQRGEGAGRIKWLNEQYSSPEADAWWRLALRDTYANLEEALNKDFAHWRELLLKPLTEALEP
ncbi:MAG: hypothetical protein LBQ75_10615, partial [Zoogloeaceae bacterium]|nr:hypothetical protein [Zoogloeaceae bacterium]